MTAQGNALGLHVKVATSPKGTALPVANHATIDCERRRSLRIFDERSTPVVAEC
ncbi:MAG: hypothetical protein ACI8P0_000457 [Planctomycetaceae bacterium]|jgi:hypothetical protein